MHNYPPHITVCICTYQRVQLLKDLIEKLDQQETQGEFTHSIVVTDNDSRESARETIQQLSATLSTEITYISEPRRNIAHARNKSLEPAKGDFIAFIDDDEFPDSTWLCEMMRACIRLNSSGVLGPVIPYYDSDSPTWVKRSGLYERPGHPTGHEMPWQLCRTGNVLFKRSIIQDMDIVFSPEFGTGGSDVDFFKRMIARGHRFKWCAEGPVNEHIPPNRWRKSNLLRRALLRGQNNARQRESRSLKSIGKSLIAIPCYLISLPFLAITQYHLYIRHIVKLCDHLGKILAICGYYPIKMRDM